MIIKDNQKVVDWIRTNGPYKVGEEIISGNDLLKRGDEPHVLSIRGRDCTIAFQQKKRYFKTIDFKRRL